MTTLRYLESRAHEKGGKPVTDHVFVVIHFAILKESGHPSMSISRCG